MRITEQSLPSRFSVEIVGFKDPIKCLVDEFLLHNMRKGSDEKNSTLHQWCTVSGADVCHRFNVKSVQWG